MKLTSDERADLIDLLSHDGIKVLIKAMDGITQNINSNMLSLSLESPDAERRLYLLKAKADGAAQLNANIKAFLNSLKHPKKGGVAG